MKKVLLTTLFLFSSVVLFAQVGINTTTPNAQLDIRATNSATPSNTDGLLIPKVDVFPATSPTAAQQGMLVYLTTVSGSNVPGFYYWDNPSNSWIGISGSATGNNWALAGNIINVTTDFMGSTNDADVILKRNNTRAGRLGVNNTSFGLNALNPATSGNHNTAFGISSLPNNTTGYQNTASGVYSLPNNTTGYQNTASGIFSLYSNTTGSLNTAYGVNSLNSNTTGIFNTGLGYNTQTGNNLINATAIGASASATTSNSLVLGSIDGVNGATASVNVGIGTTAPLDRLHVVGNIRMVDGNQAAGKVLTSDANGTATWQTPTASATGNNWALAGNIINATTNFIGSTNDADVILKRNNVRAGRLGGNNTSFGLNALNPATTGYYNTAFGISSLQNNTTGYYNTTSGAYSLNSNTTGYQNTASGLSSLYRNTTGNYNTAYGVNSLNSNTTGSLNTAYGVDSLNSNTTGIFNTGLGYNTQTGNNLINATAIGASASVTTSNSLVLGSIDGVNGATASVNVGIGTTSPSRGKLEIVGGASTTINNFAYYALSNTSTIKTGISSGTNSYSIYATQRIAAQEFNAFSDSRIKNIKGISNTTNDLLTLSKIQITDYTLKDELKGQGKAYKKVIAQQVKEVYPQAVTATNTEIIPNIYKLSEIKNGWIPLKTDVKVGDKVKLIFSQNEEETIVKEVSATGFKVSSEKQGQVFVYGKEIHDFHTVDYEALSTLNISATQELLKRLEKLEAKEIENQKSLEELKNKMSQFETLMQNNSSSLKN